VTQKNIPLSAAASVFVNMLLDGKPVMINNDKNK